MELKKKGSIYKIYQNHLIMYILFASHCITLTNTDYIIKLFGLHYLHSIPFKMS